MVIDEKQYLSPSRTAGITTETAETALLKSHGRESWTGVFMAFPHESLWGYIIFSVPVKYSVRWYNIFWELRIMSLRKAFSSERKIFFCFRASVSLFTNYF